MEKRRFRSAVALAGCLFFAALWIPEAQGFSVASSISEPCHEKMVDRAISGELLRAVEVETVLPRDGSWRKVSRAILKDVGIDQSGLSDAESYLLMSLVVGVRFPDTDGHSVMNLDALRLVHSDPSALGTYAHCIRGPDDDYQEGNAAAVAGTRMLLREYVELAHEYMERPARERVIRQEVYLDFYGQFKTEVFAPFFYLGKAAHVLQDCFSHTVRSEEDGLEKIVHVANYVDVISDRYREKRDGLAHSDYMDRCEETDLSPIVQAAEEATKELFDAAAVAFEMDDVAGIQPVLESWMSLKPGCDFDNEMCGNREMLTLARRDPTKPYFQKVLGCSVSPHPDEMSPLSLLLMVFMPLLALALSRRLGKD